MYYKIPSYMYIQYYLRTLTTNIQFSDTKKKYFQKLKIF